MVAMEGNAPPSWRYQHPALLLSYIAMAIREGLEPSMSLLTPEPKSGDLPISLPDNINIRY